MGVSRRNVMTYRASLPWIACALAFVLVAAACGDATGPRLPPPSDEDPGQDPPPDGQSLLDELGLNVLFV